MWFQNVYNADDLQSHLITYIMQPPGRDVTAVSWGNEPGIVKIPSGNG